MLTLHLTLNNGQVRLRVNGKESHKFSLLDLSQTEQEWRDFYKNPRVYGEKLFNALFRDAARIEFDALSKQIERTIMLVLELSELDGVAWEYAYNKAKEEYVVEDCAFVRALPEKERPAKWHLKSDVDRVQLLFIPANPLVDLSGEPMRALDVDGEWREMKRHIEKSNAPFDMLELRPATPEALQSVMARFQNGMIAHFSGHGAATRGGAILLFERENGASNPLEAREFVREIKDKAWIGFLSACQSAVPERTEFSNLARELAKAGVPFALGMQFNLPDPFAPNISGQFYNYLAHGHAVPEAARQARRAVKRENEFFVGMIALYAADAGANEGKLSWRGAGAQTVSLFRPADVSDLPSPASGLIGRQRELMRLGTRLLEGKKPLTVTLHGAGGIGKTALLWQALLRFAPSFELTLAIGLDPLPSLESVLGRVERFLGLPSPCSNDTKEREALVRNALTSKRTLLGLDNFETLNYALNEKGSDKEKTAKSLHTFFKSLAANGVTLCVTSREITNLGGEIIEDIQGLTNESGGRLFQENVVRQKDEIYIEKTQQVSEMVGGHPLALRLLASAFDDRAGTSLDQYIENMQSFLPKARDKWTEEDRHESLRASFDFSMSNLLKTKEGKELQIALSRLSVFIAFFADFIAAPVLQDHVPENNEEFEQMRPQVNSTLHALWERGLLERTTLPFFEEEDYYLYRLHPALRVFAREHLADVDTNAVQENYWQSMINLASIVEEQRTKDPVVSQIALRSIPDLVYAAESRNDRDAAHMQFWIGKLLRQFGMYNESQRMIEKSQGLTESQGNLQGRAATLHEKATILRDRGDLDAALELYNQSLEIKEDLSDFKNRAATLGMMAKIYVTRGDLDIAMKLNQEALEIYEGLDDSLGKATTLNAIAQIYVTRGNLDGAIQLYQQTLEIKERLGDLQGIGATLNAMANVYETRGDFGMAMNLYQQSLEINESLGDTKSKGVSLGNMAKIYAKQGNFDGAMRLFQDSLEIEEGLHDLEGKGSTLHEMASIYDTRGDIDKAMRLYQQSLEIEESLGNLKGKSGTLANMAYIHVQRGDLSNAMKLYKQSLEIDEALGFRRGQASTLGMIAQIDAMRKDYPESMRKLLMAMSIALEIGANSNAQEIAKNLKVLQSMMGYSQFKSLWQKLTGQSLPDWLA